ncbi:MAG TPA: hypothetical protein VGR71_08815 [Nitrospira sp.]|nr:hypothetical protein [Nitrospira sp.]
MNPIRRELLNGLLVLVVASLLSVAFSAFQVSFDVHLWALILMGIAIAVGFYVVFELTLGFMSSTDEREKVLGESMRRREEEWLKRVGTPARLELNQEGAAASMVALGEVAKAIRPGNDYTVMYYFDKEGGKESPALKAINAFREELFSTILEQLKRGKIREYKRILCFDHDVLANDHELKSGVLRVGEGPGTIERRMGDHCRLMMVTKGCSLYVAPVVLRSVVVLCGQDQASITVETTDQDGGRTVAGNLFFSDPPNGEIIEQFRQMERETERRMVAVHKIRFPADAEPTTNLAAR